MIVWIECNHGSKPHFQAQLKEEPQECLLSPSLLLFTPCVTPSTGLWVAPSGWLLRNKTQQMWWCHSVLLGYTRLTALLPELSLLQSLWLALKNPVSLLWTDQWGGWHDKELREPLAKIQGGAEVLSPAAMGNASCQQPQEWAWTYILHRRSWGNTAPAKTFI